jgi:hypothetical protein
VGRQLDIILYISHSKSSSIQVTAIVQFSAMWKMWQVLQFITEKNWSTGGNSHSGLESRNVSEFVALFHLEL